MKPFIFHSYFWPTNPVGAPKDWFDLLHFILGISFKPWIGIHDNLVIQLSDNSEIETKNAYCYSQVYLRYYNCQFHYSCSFLRFLWEYFFWRVEDNTCVPYFYLKYSIGSYDTTVRWEAMLKQLITRIEYLS